MGLQPTLGNEKPRLRPLGSSSRPEPSLRRRSGGTCFPPRAHSLNHAGQMFFDRAKSKAADKPLLVCHPSEALASGGSAFSNLSVDGPQLPAVGNCGGSWRKLTACQAASIASTIREARTSSHLPAATSSTARGLEMAQLSPLRERRGL